MTRVQAVQHDADMAELWLLLFLIVLASIPWLGVLIVGAWSAADLYIATLLLLCALPELARAVASTRKPGSN
jgi:hypothetical protein